MKPLLITVAINGGGPARAKTPHQPCNPDSIAAEAIAAWRAGAAIIHFHGRLEDGSTTSDVAHHRAIIGRIRDAGCDAIMNVSTGDDGGNASHDQRLALIESGAEVVSLAANSFNSGTRIYDNNPQFVTRFVEALSASGVRPEIEVLDFGFLDRISGLIAAGNLRPPFHILFGFGLSGGMPPDPALLALLLRRLPADAEWGVACPVKDPETALRITLSSFMSGGHVRVGMEDCPYLPGETLATSNAEFVGQWVKTAEIWGRPVARPGEARRMLGLAQLPA